MRYFLTGFRITLTQRMRNVKSWLILLLIPLLIVGMQAALPNEQVSAPVLVGVALPEEGGEAFWDLLQLRSGTVLTFIRADTQTIDRNIAAGRWDCGVILSEDFSARLESADTDRIFTIRVGDGSAVYPLVQETISSCMASLVRVPIAQEYLAYSGITGPDSDPDEARHRLETTLGHDDRVNIAMSTFDGRPIDSFDLADRGVTVFLRWIVMVILLVWLLLCASDLGRWRCSGAVKRLIPLRSATILMCARFSADSLLGMISGCLGVLALGDGLYSCIAVVAYVLFWSCAGVLMAHFSSVWQSIPVLPAFAVTVSLLFSGVLVDVPAFIPGLSGISQWFPGKLFLRICQGQWFASLPLVCACAVFLLLSSGMDKIKKRCE